MNVAKCSDNTKIKSDIQKYVLSNIYNFVSCLNLPAKVH
jgi:hypothetical protein